MLTKLAIFNSRKHAKVILQLSDATAIQIVGENKIGKTSLIDTLNFLYIVNSRNMTFDNNKYSIKESVAHFFPDEKKSFIIFECFKPSAGGYFCILVKRKKREHDVEYYKIEKQFDENDFKNSNGSLKSFQAIQEHFLTALPANHFKSLRDKSEVFSLIYSSDSKKKAFVWITNNVKRKGKSTENSLSKIYEYLLNASLINSEALRNALIIADNREGEVLKVFSDKTKIQRIEELNETKRRLERLNGIQDEFEKFKLLVAEFQQKELYVGQLYYSFKHFLRDSIQVSQERLSALVEQKQHLETEENQLDKQRDIINEEIGRLETQKEYKQVEVERQQQVFNKIQQIINDYPLHKNLDDLMNFFSSKIAELEEKNQAILALLQSAKQLNLSKNTLERRLKKDEQEERNLKNKIQKFEQWLIRGLSDNSTIREQLNFILSEEITKNLTKDAVQKPVSQLGETLHINDGVIQLSKLPLKSLEDIERLKDDLEDIQNQIKQNREFLKAIVEEEKKKAESRQLKAKIREFERKKEALENKVSVEETLEKANKALKEIVSNLDDKIRKRQEINTAFKNIDARLVPLRNEIRIVQDRLQKYEIWESDFLEETILPVEELVEKDIEEIRNILKRELLNRKKLVEKKGTIFRNLQQKTNIFKAEPQFIEEVQLELLTIKDKEVTIKELLETISNEFTVPVSNFLTYYDHFKGFISRFNREISKYKISDLQSLKIVIKNNEKLKRDLEKIKNIKTVKDVGLTMDLFATMDSSEQKQGLETLRKYIETARSFEFLDMFDIELIAEDDRSQSKRIQLKKQNESTGTIRMINLMLFLSIIISLKKSDDTNKLVFFVDEDVIDSNNMAQFVQFCKDNNFIVIFAAKHQIVGLEKYYNLKKYPSHDNKVFADERNVSYARKK